MFFSKSSFEMIYFEAFANAIDAGATQFAVRTPYEYYQGDTVLCIDLHSKVSIGDKLYYKDTLHRLVGLNVISLQKEKQSFESVSEGKTGVKVDVKVPRNREIFKLMDEFVATTV